MWHEKFRNRNDRKLQQQQQQHLIASSPEGPSCEILILVLMHKGPRHPDIPTSRHSIATYWAR